MELNDLLQERYPRNITLREGTRLTLRPLKQTDEAALHAFFQGVSDGVRTL